MVSKLAKAIGRMNADVEKIVEETSESYMKAFEKLLTSPKGRMPGIWIPSGADLGMTIEDLGEIPLNDRDEGWTEAMNAMFAAANVQALYQSGVMERLIKASERNGESVNNLAASMSQEEIKEVVAELPGSDVTGQSRAEDGVEA